MSLLNRAKSTTSTTGTGTMTLGPGAALFLSWANAGAKNNRAYRYLIDDSTSWELGWGVYSSSGTTLTRNLMSSSTGSLINLSGSATVSCVSTLQDIAPPVMAPRITGSYVTADTVGPATGTAASSANLLNFYPISLALNTDAVAVEVTTLSSGNNVRGGIYTCHPTTGLPHLLIEEGAMQSTTTTGVKIINFAAPIDLYEPVWIATVFSAAVTCRSITNAISNNIGLSSFNTASSNLRLTTPFTFGALPSDLNSYTFTGAATGYPNATLRIG